MPDGGNEYYSSCDSCRTRKFKCTKERPACDPCIQLGLQCKYSRKASRTPLTRTNLTSAEDRVRELETALAALFPEVELDIILSSIVSRNSTKPLDKDGVQPSKKSLFLKAEQSHDNQLASESLPLEADGFDWNENAVTLSEVADGMAALSINPEGAGYLGATSSVVPLRTLLSKERDIGEELRETAAWNSQYILSNQMPPNLPFSNNAESSFVEAYFRYYHQTYPFLHEPSFRAQLQGRISQPGGNSWPILLNAVLALGAWCIGDDESVIDDFFYRKVTRLCEDSSIFESANLALVQALLLLSNYAQKRNRPNTGWNYLGLAVRMALSLGLHKEFPNWEITLLQREMRRRVWWGLFIFDSGASITFGRPVLLPESGIMDASQVLNIHEETLNSQTTSLPTEIHCPTVYTSVIYQSNFHSMTNSLHHRLISSPSPSPQDLLSLSRTIDAWEGSIPKYFQLESADIQFNETFLFGRCRLSWRSWNLKIILFRPVILQWAARLRKSDESNTPETGEELECRRKCIECASMTINSISDFIARNMVSRLSNWYMLYFLFQAGLVPIICLMTDPMHPDSATWLADILTTKSLLNRTAATNRLAARCLSVFDRITPVVESLVPEDVDLGAWEGVSAEWQNEQFGAGMGVWDWANSEMNWTI